MARDKLGPVAGIGIMLVDSFDIRGFSVPIGIKEFNEA